MAEALRQGRPVKCLATWLFRPWKTELTSGRSPDFLLLSLQNRWHTPASLRQCMTRVWAIHWSFPAQGTWHRTGFADQAPGQGMCHTHTLIRVP